MFSPLTKKRFRRFRSIKRGWWSFVLLAGLFALSLVAELFIGHRALVVNYDGKLHFPVYGKFHPGTDFGESYDYETNYRALRDRLSMEKRGWVLMPPVPYGPKESDYRAHLSHPMKPNLAERHLLGTDTTGRDVFARIVYGFRIVMLFSLGFTAAVYLISVVIGCAMGYFGGWVDLFGQRLVEIWSNIPFLYMVIIGVALIPPDVGVVWRITLLLAIMVAFSWSDKTAYLRTASYKEKARDYVSAAQLLGASPARVIFNHILPNTVSTLVTFLPFTVAMAIASLTALDFLNFGLPRPTPSWGEMMQMGLGNLYAPWMVSAGAGALIVVLLLVTFIGEAVREAFDPRRFTVYR